MRDLQIKNAHIIIELIFYLVKRILYVTRFGGGASVMPAGSFRGTSWTNGVREAGELRLIWTIFYLGKT